LKRLKRDKRENERISDTELFQEKAIDGTLMTRKQLGAGYKNIAGVESMVIACIYLEKTTGSLLEGRKCYSGELINNNHVQAAFSTT
jgi:hypothetical protein